MKPMLFPVRCNDRFGGGKEWKAQLKEKLHPGVSAVVMILPGCKGKAPLYDELKAFLQIECPVPSQVVLSSTLQKGKNLRSIAAKILIQMNAKIGGEPWFIDKLPLMD